MRERERERKRVNMSCLLVYLYRSVLPFYDQHYHMLWVSLRGNYSTEQFSINIDLLSGSHQRVHQTHQEMTGSKSHDVHMISHHSCSHGHVKTHTGTRSMTLMVSHKTRIVSQILVSSKGGFLSSGTAPTSFSLSYVISR